jgi:prophage maintenance system killer protein
LGIVAATLFSESLWRRVNDHFRSSGQFYVEAPRPRSYQAKVRHMYRVFPHQLSLPEQAAFLVKNLVNLQRYPDANKRTASVLVEVFLEDNGFELTCSNDEYARFLLAVQRQVPSDAWDGRTFTLKTEYIPPRDDAYHGFLVGWMRANTKKKS